MKRTYFPVAPTREGERAVQLTSHLFHPYVLIAVAVFLLAYKALPGEPQWPLWALVALLPAYLLPIGYMRIRGLIVYRRTGVKPGLRSFFREKPLDMLILALLFGIPSLLILHFLGSPPELMQVMGAITISSVVIAMVNRLYRASFHLGIFTTLAVILTLEFRSPLAIGILILLGLIVGGAKYYLHEHSPLQILAGILIGLAGAATAVLIF